MRLSLKVVERLLNTKLENVEALTQNHIYEVENYFTLINIEGLILGHVLKVEDHPNSDHLHICQVDLGTNLGSKQIVCGAANVRSGQFVIVSPIGVKLPGGEIKAATIRGVESQGMICSLKELGLDEKFIEDKYKNGIFYFTNDMSKQVGTNPLEVMELNAKVIDYNVPPNRFDLLSAVGYAREIGACSNAKIHLKEYPLFKNNINPPVIKLTHRIPYYSITKVCNLTINESPWWLKSALIASDIRPINNIVDISNYIMIRYGLPNHMFDAAIWKSNSVNVRLANPNEEVVTLDGVHRNLSATDVLICDNETPVALAGVMGLENTMIKANTKDILIEFGSFLKEEVANTSKTLKLISESSLRFEKGIDEALIETALNECLYLLVLLANAKIGMTQSINNRKYDNHIIDVKFSYFDKMIGKKIESKDIVNILKNLDFEVKVEDKSIKIKIPSYRPDLKEEADILEEVLRFLGLNTVNAKNLKSFQIGYLTTAQKRLRKIREVLSGFGYNEVINYSLIKNPFEYSSLSDPIAVLAPLSEDHRYLRPTLINGLIDCYNYNKSYGQNNLDQDLLLADFQTINAALKRVLWEFYLDYHLEANQKHRGLNPYRSANIIINEEEVGLIGEIILNKNEKVWVVELDLDFINDDKVKAIELVSLSKYPSITRDIAFYVDQKITNRELEELITQTTKKYLIDLKIFDIYAAKDDSNRKSIAYHLTFNDPTKTLESLEVDKLMQSLVNRLEWTFKASIRKG